MSTPASRQRQRQRRRAREKLWAAQSALAERHVDLVSYERVIADMNRRYREGLLSPFSGAQTIAIVEALRNATRAECTRLEAEVAKLQSACEKLEPKPSDPKTTLTSP